MKDLSTFIKDNIVSEAIRINKYTKLRSYKYIAEDILHLASIIKEKIKKEEYDLNDIDTSQITNMSNLFKIIKYTKADDVKKLNFENWDVSNVKKMSGMFYYAPYLTGDLSNWDVSNVTDMSDMFQGCSNMHLDISKWNVSKVEDFSNMFAYCSDFNCDISNWDVSSGKNFQYMFAYCNNLDFDVSKWNMASARSTNYMFYNCQSMKNIPTKLPMGCSRSNMFDNTHLEGQEQKIKIIR